MQTSYCAAIELETLKSDICGIIAEALLALPEIYDALSGLQSRKQFIFRCTCKFKHTFLHL